MHSRIISCALNLISMFLLYVMFLFLCYFIFVPIDCTVCYKMKLIIELFCFDSLVFYCLSLKYFPKETVYTISWHYTVCFNVTKNIYCQNQKSIDSYFVNFLKHNKNIF
jgi:hypothetical protein